MAKIFQVDILTPEKTIYSANAVSLVVPAELGYLGVLADHAPIVAHLVKGKVTLRDESGSTKFFDSQGGFMEVLRNKATVLLSRLD